MADDALASGTPDPGQASQPSQTQEAVPEIVQAGQEQPSDWDPSSLPETERRRFARWQEKFLAEERKKRENEVGNDLQRVPAHVRRKLRQEPGYVDRLEAQVAALGAALSSGRAQETAAEGKEQPQPPEEDIEQDAAAVLKRQGWKESDEGYSALLRHDVELLRAAERRAERKAPKFDTDRIAEQAGEKLSAKQIEGELKEIMAGPSWNDPDKGADFEGRFMRRARAVAEHGGRVSPRELAREIEAELFPDRNGRAAPRQMPKPSGGDVSKGSVPSASKADAIEDFDKRLRAKGKDPATWGF